MFQMKVTGYKIDFFFWGGASIYTYIYCIFIYTDTYAQSLPAGLAETIV